MKLLVEIPSWVNNDAVPTVRLFYIQLLNFLSSEGIKYSIYPTFNILTTSIDTIDNRNFDHILRYHTSENNHQTINIKISYLPHFFYFDRTGYSGWSEFANKKFPYEDVPMDYANKIYSELHNRYVGGNISKYKQKDRGTRTFELPDKYIFLATQVEKDSVMDLSRINMNNLIISCSDIIASMGFDLVIKRHPFCKSATIDETLENIRDKAILLDYSIHDLIEHASAVIVVNSGVGIESLLHLKPVVTFGHSDYTWVTYNMLEPSELMKLPAIIDNFGEETKNSIKKFLTYFFKNYLIELNEPSSFGNALRRFNIQ